MRRRWARRDASTLAKEALQLVEQLATRSSIQSARSRLKALDKRLADPSVWGDAAAESRLLLGEQAKLSKLISQYDSFAAHVHDATALELLGEEEDDDESIAEAAILLQHSLDQGSSMLTELLFDDDDDSACFVEVHAGAGGTESCDWAAMLLRMYSMWARKQGFRCDTIEATPGAEVGIKKAMLQIEGDLAFGWLRGETGVHRMVRLSPFDSSKRRHTTFASVMVSPVVEEGAATDLEILSSDLRIDTYRASGAGGQHVNTTDSAVRLTHIPTGLVVTCQKDRSQHRNKALALAILKGRLRQQELDAQASAKVERASSLDENGWSNQIRSYVMHPYSQVKDGRTGTTACPHTTLDGELAPFLRAHLGWRHGGLK